MKKVILFFILLGLSTTGLAQEDCLPTCQQSCKVMEIALTQCLALCQKKCQPHKQTVSKDNKETAQPKISKECKDAVEKLEQVLNQKLGPDADTTKIDQLLVEYDNLVKEKCPSFPISDKSNKANGSSNPH